MNSFRWTVTSSRSIFFLPIRKDKVMHEKIEKAKQHLKDHKTIYIVGGVAVFTCLIVRRGCYATLSNSVDSSGSPPVSVHPFSIFSKSGDIITTVHNGHRGHPGFRTRNLETGAMFNTQADAASAFGVSERNLSQHLNGKYSNAEGFHFERLAA